MYLILAFGDRSNIVRENIHTFGYPSALEITIQNTVELNPRQHVGFQLLNILSNFQS